MDSRSVGLADSISEAVRRVVADAGTVTAYREPLIGFADAGDPRFAELRRVADPRHMMPEDLVTDAQSIVSFFLPFDPAVVEANAQQRRPVAREWALAYVETNNLIARITDDLVGFLDERGIRAAGQPATHTFDSVALTSRWSHKSVGVIAGLGSFGFHRMVITDAGCAGRFGSVVTDAALPHGTTVGRERCLAVRGASCRACVDRCPVGALGVDGSFDRQRCYDRCLEVGTAFQRLGASDVCGKCAVGPCSVETPVG